MKNRFVTFAENFLMTFAVIVLIFTALTAAVGSEAAKKSSLFLLGGSGIAVMTLLELLAFSLVICLLRLLFFTDIAIKNMGKTLRFLIFFITAALFLALFALVFKWIPNSIGYWLLVFACYAVSTGTSIFVSHLTSKKEDERLNIALKKMSGEK